MKLSCLQENLTWGLGVVGRAVAARTTLPITNNILLETDQSRLKLVATNLEMAVVCWIGAKVEEEGTITIPAKLLTEFIAALPKDKVDMAMAPKTKTLTLRCARFEARISGMDARDFPPIPNVEHGLSTSIEVDALKMAISQVVFAAASEESRPVLTGVDVKFDGSTLTMAAADGFRLAVHKTTLSRPVAQKMEVIVPAKTLTELSRLMADQTEPVEMMVNPGKSQVLFKLKNIELVSQLIQGNFPQYEQLIPTASGTRATVDVTEFLRATRTAAIFARDGTGIVRLIVSPGGDLTPGKLTVSARSEEIGEDVGDIDAIVVGNEAKIAFNGKYLTDVLNVIKEAQVCLETSSPSSPGVIKPVGSESYVHVVMPMFVQW
ncbi:MAG TPA: DNA polymerase III subunit beta [Dehalococcoidales bacterium]|nr:DNA polymerase III subunit beta [Dehalococcoidales bacterium]